MARKLTFLHTADLHLGAPLRGLRALSEKWADRVAQAIPDAFDALIETALSRRVDFVIIAGDIFDQATPSYANYLHFASGLQRLDAAGIPSYLCTGNHDPYTSWRHDLADLPASAHMFSADKPSFFVFEKGGEAQALLGGRGFYNHVFDEGANIAEGITRSQAEDACGQCAPFAIGVIHSGLNLDPFKAPTNPGQLLRAGMDYWALGHIHMPWQDSPDNPRIVFPGCIQGRDVKEVGPRGCSIVTLEEGKPNTLEFVPLASIVWQLLNIDASSCTTIADLSQAISKELYRESGRAQCNSMVVRVVLMGKSRLHYVLQEPGILADLRDQINAEHPDFFCDSIRDETKAPIDKDALFQEGLFPSVLMGVAQEFGIDEEASLSFLQDEFIARGIALPASLSTKIGELETSALDTALDVLHCGVAS